MLFLGVFIIVFSFTNSSSGYSKRFERTKDEYKRKIISNIGITIGAFIIIGSSGALIIKYVNKIYLFWILISFLAIYMPFRLGSIIRNKFITKKYDDGLIYVRDIDVDYSPAVLSYLYNQELEIKKDVTATVLNLCVKKVLKIDENGIYVASQELPKNITADEKYIYDCILRKERFDSNKWREIVQAEFRKLEFVNKRKINILLSVIILSVLSIVIALLYRLYGEEMVIAMMTAGLILFLLYASKFIIKDTHMKYTQRGAVELSKWKKFKAFLKDFTLINEAPAIKIVLLEKYLSYGMALNINKKYSTRIMKELNIDLSINILDKIKDKLEEEFEEFQSIYG